MLSRTHPALNPLQSPAGPGASLPTSTSVPDSGTVPPPAPLLPGPAKSCGAGSSGGVEGHSVKGYWDSSPGWPELGEGGEGSPGPWGPAAPCPPAPTQSRASPRQSDMLAQVGVLPAQVGVWRWQDKQSLVLGVVPPLPGGRLGTGSLPCLGPRLNVWVGRKSRGFRVRTLTSRSQALWAGRPRWDLKFSRPIQTCSYRPTFLLARGHTRPGGTGRADSPAAQMGGWELGPQQDSRCDVPTPRTDFASQPGSDHAGKGPRIAGQVTAPPWAPVSPAVKCQELAGMVPEGHPQLPSPHQELRGGGVGGSWLLGVPGCEGFSHISTGPLPGPGLAP